MAFTTTLSGLVVSLLGLTASVAQGQTTVPAKRSVGYYTYWSMYKNYFPSSIPVQNLTHLNYAFAKVDATGKIAVGDAWADIDKAYPGDVWDTAKQPFRGNFWQLNVVAKKTNPNLKTLISVGGWSGSAKFSDVALTAASRKTFAQSVATFLQTYRFDGVDIDWEFPVDGGLATNVRRAADRTNYVLLLQEIRKALDLMTGSRRLLTIAVPASAYYAKNFDLVGINTVVDAVNAMEYDFRGEWSLTTGHQAALFRSQSDPEYDNAVAISTSIVYYLNNGMAASKINLGIPLYGRGFANVPATNNGLWQPFSGVPRGTFDDASGVFQYWDIKAKIASGIFKQFNDTSNWGSYAYSAANKTFVSFDDVSTVKEKCNFIKNRGIGGAMFWDLAGDDTSSTLIKTVASGLNIVW